MSTAVSTGQRRLCKYVYRTWRTNRRHARWHWKRRRPRPPRRQPVLPAPNAWPFVPVPTGLFQATLTANPARGCVRATARSNTRSQRKEDGFQQRKKTQSPAVTLHKCWKLQGHSGIPLFGSCSFLNYPGTKCRIHLTSWSVLQSLVHNIQLPESFDSDADVLMAI